MSAQRELSMQNQAYQFIREKIASCEYAPNQMLSESFLQDQLGFSRTPIREAIGRLAQEGLVKVFPKRGIMVSGISINDIHKIFEVRLLVEPYILRTYGENVDLAAVERLSQMFRAFSDKSMNAKFYNEDDEFHAIFIAALENEYLRGLYDRIKTPNIRLRVVSGEHSELRLRETLDEHIRIADACLARDWEAAAQAMTIHLKNSKQSSLDAVMGGGSGVSIV